jgi:molecular chaperone GrpE
MGENEQVSQETTKKSAKEKQNTASEAEPSERAETSQEKNQGEGLPKEEQVDYKSKYLYQLAEVQNLKKRMSKDREDLLRYGNERLVQDLLLVIDNLERALQAGQDKSQKDPLLQGVRMVLSQFESTLNSHGVEKIEAEGKTFDPELHESVGKKKASNEDEVDKIVEVQLNGYKINGRLLRPAKVVVATANS